MTESPARSFADPEHLFQQRIITLRSTNEISRWWFAAWLGLIIAFGTIGAVAFAWPDIASRVVAANQEAPV